MVHPVGKTTHPTRVPSQKSMTTDVGRKVTFLAMGMMACGVGARNCTQAEQCPAWATKVILLGALACAAIAVRTINNYAYASCRG